MVVRGLSLAHGAAHYKHLFATRSGDGIDRRLIADAAFEVDGEWLVVLRGDPARLEGMAAGASLESLGERAVDLLEMR